MELSDYSKIHQMYHREVHRMKGYQVVVQEKLHGCVVHVILNDIERRTDG